MDAVPSFSLHCSIGASSPVLGDITNLQEADEDFEQTLVAEFGDEQITLFLEEASKNGTYKNLHSENVSHTDSENRSAVPFVEIDENLINEINTGGISKSEGKTVWARRRFDAWRKHANLSTEIAIEDLDLKDLGGMLEVFMIQVVKLDGSFYPPESLQDMFRRIGCIVRRRQEIIVGNTGIEQIPFNIKYSPIFKRARLACIAAMRRSKLTPGVCKKRKKVDEVGFSTEQALLLDVDHQIHHPKGLQKRILYYCVSRFGIRAQEELELVKLSDFVVASENGKEFVEYSERLSKQYDVSMDRYQEESFRMPLRCYEEDVVLTFKQYIRHYPEQVDMENNWLFKQAIVNPRKNAWYNVKHRVNGRKLSEWMKYMLALIGVTGTFSGKSGRTTLISRMSRAGVPTTVGMKVTGHRTAEAFSRYDKTAELQVKAAMDIAGRPFNDDGSRRMFEDVYKDELKEFDHLQHIDPPGTSALTTDNVEPKKLQPPIEVTQGSIGAALVEFNKKDMDTLRADDEFLNFHWDSLEKFLLARRSQQQVNVYNNCVFNVHPKI